MPDGLSLLVVDDDKALLEVLTTLLSQEGHNVVAVPSGYEAFDLLGQREFDLVLVDLKMRRMNGLELLEAEKVRHPEARIVVMTAYATVDAAVQALRSGAYDFLTKPFKLTDLRAIIRRVEEQKRATAA
jgi:DNA-binding NtrC family response regulator